MRRRKQSFHILGIPNLPNTPVPTGRVTTHQSVIAEDATEQARRNQARINDPKRKQELRMFWQRDFADIEADKDRLPFDDLGLPKTDELDVQTATRCISAFPTVLEQKGVTLSRDGWRRFAYYAWSHVLNGVLVNNDTLEQMFDRMSDLHIFTITNEATGKKVEVRPTEPEPPKTTIADIEHATGRDERRLVGELWSEDIQNVYLQWRAFLAERFGLILSEYQHEQCLNWWRHNPDANPMLGKSWDSLRLWCVRTGVFPPSAMSREEHLADRIERTNLSRMTFDERQKLVRQLDSFHSVRPA